MQAPMARPVDVDTIVVREGRHMISVRVTVLGDVPRSVMGSVDEDTSFAEITASIAKALQLQADEWIFAVSPADSRTTFGAFAPKDGDDIYLIRRRSAKGEPFLLADDKH